MTAKIWMEKWTSDASDDGLIIFENGNNCERKIERKTELRKVGTKWIDNG